MKSSDRLQLIRLAAKFPVGDDARRVILAGLNRAGAATLRYKGFGRDSESVTGYTPSHELRSVVDRIALKLAKDVESELSGKWDVTVLVNDFNSGVPNPQSNTKYNMVIPGKTVPWPNFYCVILKFEGEGVSNTSKSGVQLNPGEKTGTSMTLYLSADFKKIRMRWGMGSQTAPFVYSRNRVVYEATSNLEYARKQAPVTKSEPAPQASEEIFKSNTKWILEHLKSSLSDDSYRQRGVAGTFQEKIEIRGSDGKIILSFPQYKWVSNYDGLSVEYEARTVTFVFPNMKEEGLYIQTDAGDKLRYDWGGVDISGWMLTVLLKFPAKKTQASIQAEQQRLKQLEEKETSSDAPLLGNAGAVAIFLESMRTSSGGRNISVEYSSPEESGGWHLWDVEPQNRTRLDGDDDEGDGGWGRSYSSSLRGEVQEKLDDRFGKGIFEVDIGEKGHIEVQGNPRKIDALMGVSGKRAAMLPVMDEARMAIKACLARSDIPQSKTAANARISIRDRGVFYEYYGNDPHVYDCHIVDSYKNPKTVVALATEALNKLAPRSSSLTYSEVIDFVNEYVFNGSKGRWSSVRWNSKSYPD